MVGQALVAAEDRLARPLACYRLPQKMVDVLWPLHEAAHDAITVVPLMAQAGDGTEPRPFGPRHVLASWGDRIVIDQEQAILYMSHTRLSEDDRQSRFA